MRETGTAALAAAFALFASAGPRAAGAGLLSAGDAAGPAEPAPRVQSIALSAEVPLALRAAVSRECLQLALSTGGAFRLWPALRVRAAEPLTTREPAFLRARVNFAIEPGSLIAVASWDSPWRDYRDQPIRAGTYALVYAIQPAFKQHRGVSEFRDVLLLVRPSDALAGGDLTRLVAASRLVSGTSHPAVAALFPVDRGAELPRVSQRRGGEHALEFRAGSFQIGLAVSGKGRLEAVEF